MVWNVKLRYCSVISGVVLLALLPFQTEARITFPNDENLGPDYNAIGERSRSLILNGESDSRELASKPLNIIQQSPSTKIHCDAVEWPKQNYVSGPFAVNVDVALPVYAKLCPERRGIFETPTSCDVYVICQNDCMTINRCPSFQYFNPNTKSCVPADTYKCVKPVNRTTTNSNVNYNNQKFDEPKSQNRRSQKVRILINPPRLSAQQSSLSEFPTSQSNFGQGNAGLSGNYLESKSQKFSSSGPIDCKEEQEGIFAHPESCNFYIRCANGNQLTQRCPHGTVFNSDLFYCDWERNVPECKRNRGSNIRLKRFINKPVEELPDLYGNRVEHIILKRSPSPKPKASTRCTPSANYIMPHAEYCNKYEVCSNGKVFIETCGPGTLFDPYNTVCNFPDKVDCESRKADLGTYGCQKQHTYRTSHWEFCNKFVECDKGVLAVKSCPSGLVYDVESSDCNYAHKIECKKPISLEHDTDVNPGQPVALRSTRSISDYVCDGENYIAPHPRCNKFVECEEKRLFVKSCGPGTVYNRYIGQCDWSYNTREPDDNDCNAYRECRGGEWKGRTCRADLVFNPLTRKCDRPENVECRRREEAVIPAESK